MRSLREKSPKYYWPDWAARLLRSNWLAGGTNLWALFFFLALSGWLIDSLLVALQLHKIPGGGFQVHLLHLWYVPPLLVAALLLVRKRLARRSGRGEDPPAFDDSMAGLGPEVRALAERVAASETSAALLAFLRLYPNVALTSADLAGHTGHDPSEVEHVLSELDESGFVEKQCLCDMVFYRLTGDAQRRAWLDEVAAWQERWLEQSRLLTEEVGRSLSHHKGQRTG